MRNMASSSCEVAVSKLGRLPTMHRRAALRLKAMVLDGRVNITILVELHRLSE